MAFIAGTTDLMPAHWISPHHSRKDINIFVPRLVSPSFQPTQNVPILCDRTNPVQDELVQDMLVHLEPKSSASDNK